ncbi:MAG: DUF1415 domain-containing protein [Betaproteobacteria bacterium]|nr:DUF1415 domain-containing protein [Betaproteobacteria bacterium]
MTELIDPAAEAAIVAETRTWIEAAVIGLDLCPFAGAVYREQRIRYAVTAAEDAESLRDALAAELEHLAQTDPDEVETTLLIHPRVFADFLDYNDFLGEADALVRRLGLEGEIQVASFHPQYQFADSAPDDIGNCTNRSPYATLHLLREASIERALYAWEAAGRDPAEIYRKNIETLRSLGREGWERLRARVRGQGPEISDR